MRVLHLSPERKSSMIEQNPMQTDDHVQNSALGSHNPVAYHPSGKRLVPVSAATPDDEPKAERKKPPQVTGHDIGPHIAKSSTTGVTAHDKESIVVPTKEQVFPRVTTDKVDDTSPKKV